MRVFTAGLIMSICASVFARDNGGASAAWTSNDPIIVQARNLIAAGNLHAAERLLAMDDSSAAAQTREIIRRIRLEYPLDAPALLQKIKAQVSDLSSQDLDRWTSQGQLQFRILDGQLRYFRREPANLFRFSPEAKARKTTPEAPKFDLISHLRQIISESSRTQRPDVLPLHHRIRYEITIPHLKPGQEVRCWLPFPQELPRQTAVKLLGSWPQGAVLAPNGSPHRSLYFQTQSTSDEVKVGAEFEYICTAYYPDLQPDRAQPLPVNFDPQYLSERLPHIHLAPETRELAQTIVGHETNPLLRARKIFEWVDREIRYNAEEEYSIIPSLCDRGLSRRKGDCGIQAAVFITLCRAAGIPARWQSGWETRPPDGDMHDWTEIYIAPWGWLPADPSYGLQRSDDAAVRWFYLGHQDSHRLIINLDYGQPLSPPKSDLRSEPADFQRGEVEVDGKNLYFDQWEYDMTFTCEPTSH